MVLSLTAKGLTSGEIVAHLAEVYGMTTKKETVSTITDSHVVYGSPVVVTQSLTDVLLGCPCFDLSDRRGPVPRAPAGRSMTSGAWPEAP